MGAWARVTLASIPPERTSMLAAMTLIFRMCRLILGLSLHDDLADHALLIVAGDEARELECAALGELPNDLAVAVRQQALCIRIIMLHVWVLFHHLRVLPLFSDRNRDVFG